MVIEFAFELAQSLMQQMGYLGVFLLMALESTAFPMPSEAVMPLAGYLVSKGVFDFWTASAAAAFGSIFGSLISYLIGMKLGRIFFEKYGKYFFIRKHELEWTDKWFRRHGGVTVFAGRFMPVVRHLISIPAGIARMDIRKFLLYTFAGAFAWNTILLYAGLWFGERWKLIYDYAKTIDILIAAGIIAAAVWFFIGHRRKKDMAMAV
ncbi:MAG: DedA family protein [Candidatus Aenigmarchaeota archaeon]|nr:DedA family protein [Candidatus Aenigmarchaeota archaeon]